jgi:hypothetical protein
MGVTQKHYFKEIFISKVWRYARRSGNSHYLKTSAIGFANLVPQ